MRRATFLMAVLLCAGAARAQKPAVVCTCDRKADRFEINYIPITEDMPPIPKAIDLMSLLDTRDDGRVTMVTRIRSKTIRCRLSHDRFELKLNPGVPNRNLAGYCGMAVTAVVTVKRNGTLVIDGRWLESNDCEARDATIDRITFRDGVAEPEVHQSPVETQ